MWNIRKASFLQCCLAAQAAGRATLALILRAFTNNKLNRTSKECAQGSLNFHRIMMKQRPFYSVTFLIDFPIQLFMKINFKKLQEIKQINNNDIF